MKKGYVCVKLVKVIVEGSAGVGKTSLVYLLLSKNPPEERNSTSCAEQAIRVIRVGKEGEEWSEISTKEFQEMISEAIPILHNELKRKGDDKNGNGEDGMGQEGGDVEGEESGVVEGEEGTNADRQSEGGKEKVDGQNSKKNNSSPSAEHIKAVIDGVIQKLTDMHMVSDGRSSCPLLNVELIYLTDCDGQQAFWDLAPIFTYDASAVLFVHRLCEKLDEHPLNNFYRGGERIGPSQRATLTTSQAFKTMLRGLNESDPQQGLHQDKRQGGHESVKQSVHKGSKIVAVGTHKDLVDECEEKPEEKSRKLAMIASPHFIDDVVYRNESMEEIVFQVNTKCPKDEDKKEAHKIRASIEKGARRQYSPIWWFILQMILEALSLRLGRKVLSKDECLHVSNTLNFSEEQLDAALVFFDKLNIFLYKKEILPGVVFTNPQVPLDKLTKLVEKQHHLKDAEADPTKAADCAMTGEWKRFRDNGIVTLEILQEFQADYVDGMFTANDFLDLLEKLLVISKLSPTEYLLPAILEMTDKAIINEFLTTPRTSKIAALVVHFPTGWAPPGVYCCSACHLQSHSHWEVISKAQSITVRKDAISHIQLPNISRNCITFTTPKRPGSVSFIDNFSFFVVHVNVDTSELEQEEIKEHCQAIQTEVFAAVEAGLKNTHHITLCPKTAFLCPSRNGACSTELHIAHVSTIGKRWICSENTNVFSSLTAVQTVWPNKTGKGPIVCVYVYSYYVGGACTNWMVY